ncbi:endonuclease [Candidatus Micrarchaeota archaeon]|nr:endonuclease [Candidatus Micrarchaeota archaeon]
MTEPNLDEEWVSFAKKHGEKAYHLVDQFLTDVEEEYKKRKIDEFRKGGVDYQTAVVKARQSWVAYVGGQLENVIFLILEPFISKKGIKLIRGNVIKGNNLSTELDMLRRALLVHFNEYSHLPDADLIIYKTNGSNVKVIAILSMKNSFRERYTETPYWKLKLGQSEVTRNIKVFMVTPDRDDEISNGKKPSKARVILEYELDGVYITKEKQEFDASAKVGNMNDLITCLEGLLKQRG